MSDEKKPAILYHYCDAVAFESILRTGEIWLSPFRHSNDTTEGSIARTVFRAVARSSQISNETIDRFFEQMDEISPFIDCYGLCLSEKGDLLSQWRGYANDGAGFAIGFNADALSFLPPSEMEPNGLSPYLANPKLHQVAYTKKTQRETLKPWFESMQQLLKDAHSIKTLKAINASDQLAMARAAQAKEILSNSLWAHWDYLFRIKHAAFSEEREWRLVASAITIGTYKFRPGKYGIIPYLTYKVPSKIHDENTIVEVIAGPRNTTPDYVIQMMLTQSGYGGGVRRSGATYR